MNVKVEHNNKTFELLDISPKNAVIESIGDSSNNYDVYWHYRCTGLHNGDPIDVAVLNPHYEADGDESGVFYGFTDEGWYWLDDMTDINDDVECWYGDAVMEIAKFEYNESAD